MRFDGQLGSEFQIWRSPRSLPFPIAARLRVVESKFLKRKWKQITIQGEPQRGLLGAFLMRLLLEYR